MPTEEIERRYSQAVGKWTGCDWPTEFGVTGLDLSGLKSSQAMLLARATSGQEASDWRAAIEWLNTVEKDARVAQEMAEKALALALGGKIVGAIFHIQSACTIEARYHNKLVWQPLREAIEAIMSTAAG